MTRNPTPPSANLLLTAWHWGSGDAHWLRCAPATRAWIWFAWGRGLLVMAAPLTFQARRSVLVLRALAALSGGSGARFSVELALRWAPFALVLALALTLLAWLAGAAPARLVVVESALLLALFWAAPPLFAITLYFAALHAWRHVLRVETVEGAPLRNAGQIGRAVARFHWRVAPVTALALLGIAPILGLWPYLNADARTLSTAFLVLISALTLPHAIVVGALDFAAYPGKFNPFAAPDNAR